MPLGSHLVLILLYLFVIPKDSSNLDCKFECLKTKIPSKEGKGFSGPICLGPGGCAKVQRFSRQRRKCALDTAGDERDVVLAA